MAKGKYAEWLTAENLIRIQGWARDGLDLEQIAANMGITRETLRQWRNTYPAISSALKSGRDVADRNVENALYKRALGYEYKETTIEPNDVGEMVVTKVVQKQVAPDTTAGIFWLKNRKPKEWRDRVEKAITGADGGPLNVQQIADADIDKRIAELESKLNK